MIVHCWTALHLINVSSLKSKLPAIVPSHRVDVSNGPFSDFNEEILCACSCILLDGYEIWATVLTSVNLEYNLMACQSFYYSCGMNSIIHLSRKDFKVTFLSFGGDSVCSSSFCCVCRVSFCKVLLMTINLQSTHQHRMECFGLIGKIQAGDPLPNVLLLCILSGLGWALKERGETESKRKIQTQCERLSSHYQ